jgi:GDSL-like Lipase/Acylhydrolase family
MLIQLRELHTNLSDPDFLLLLRASGKYKQRSDQTHDSVHEPLLTENPLEPIWCLLLGDSMLERLKTTGARTDLGKGQFPHIFNAGVGGDRIQNVLYRLDTKGLFWDLKSHRVKYAVLHMGTNDLRPKRGLNFATLTQYSLVVEALHRAAPGIKILVTGLMPRTDVDEVFIHRSNQALQNLVQEYNELVGQKLGKQSSLLSLPQANCSKPIHFCLYIEFFPSPYVSDVH